MSLVSRRRRSTIEDSKPPVEKIPFTTSCNSEISEICDLPEVIEWVFTSLSKQRKDPPSYQTVASQLLNIYPNKTEIVLKFLPSMMRVLTKNQTNIRRKRSRFHCLWKWCKCGTSRKSRCQLYSVTPQPTEIYVISQ